MRIFSEDERPNWKDAKVYFIASPFGVVEKDYRTIDLLVPTLGGQRHPDPEHWHIIRIQALERDCWACVLCNSHTRQLDVHHRDYSRWGRELITDIYTLCRPCHAKHHDIKDGSSKRRAA